MKYRTVIIGAGGALLAGVLGFVFWWYAHQISLAPAFYGEWKGHDAATGYFRLTIRQPQDIIVRSNDRDTCIKILAVKRSTGDVFEFETVGDAGEKIEISLEILPAGKISYSYRLPTRPPIEKRIILHPFDE